MATVTLTPESRRPRPRLGLWAAWGTLVAAIVILSLYPFHGWKASADLPWSFLFKPFPKYRTSFDLWTNLLAYLPLGWVTSRLLVARHLRIPQQAARALFGTLLVALSLSFCMEALQTFLPSRRSQSLDLLANAAGAAMGSLLALLAGPRPAPLGSAISPLDDQGTHQLWAPMVLIVLWCLAQAAPMRLWPGLGDLLPSQWSVRPFAWASGAEPIGVISLAERMLTESLMVVAALLAWSLLLERTRQLLEPRWSWMSRGSWPLVLVLGLVSSGLLRLGWTLVLAPSADSIEGLRQAVEVWLTAGVQTGLLLAALLGAALAGLSQQGQARLVMVLLVSLVVLSSSQPDSGYDHLLSQGWSQGQWLHLRGLASWSAAVWPLACFVWLAFMSLPRIRIRPGSVGSAGKPPTAGLK